MFFSQLERRAILTMANGMIQADGKVDKNEIKTTFQWLLGLGFDASDFQQENLDPAQALGIISNLSLDEKKVVTSLLYHIMISDGNIDEKEQAFLDLTAVLCKLPNMTKGDVITTLEQLRDGLI